MIALPGNRWLLIENKTKQGRLSDDQKDLGNQFAFLGHNVYVIKSYKRFLEIAEAQIGTRIDDPGSESGNGTPKSPIV